MNRSTQRLAVFLALAAFGCSSSSGGGSHSGGELSFEGTVTGDCPEFADREVLEISGEINADVTWGCDVVPLLTEHVFVTENATVTVEDGTWVFGDKGSSLIVTKGSRLVTKGKATSPVVFTSSLATEDRAGGDWGGIVLLGSAPINLPDSKNQIEGLDPADTRGEYGGNDAASDCGSLEYTRIEYAGELFSVDNELNALTIGACGSGTKLSYLQMHKGLDDGIEFFGGTAKMDHIVITGSEDDGLDWDEGWKGGASFVIVQQHPGTGDSGIEADNLDEDNAAEPRSAPSIHNITLIGPNEADGSQSGMVLRRGTAGIIQNAIVMGFGSQAIDIRDEATVAQTEGATPKLAVTNSAFFEMGGPGGDAWFADEPTDGSEEDDDAGFVEADFFMNESLGNLFGTNPMVATPYDIATPTFKPSDLVASGTTDTFDGSDYLGAIDPNGDDWTAGWTAYP